MFQFPSNGKAYLNRSRRWSYVINHVLFQFPSNGKAYLNPRWQLPSPQDWYSVSIPFKRESVSEQFQAEGVVSHTVTCFNSLQTGKRIWTKALNGCGSVTKIVSIPFKRESVSEPRNVETAAVKSMVSIPFKRESVSEPCLVQDRSVGICFNSLQTGKRIWTELNHDVKAIEHGFNSLQTGKRIWTIHREGFPDSIQEFQFPSNGKAYLNWQRVEVGIHQHRRVSIPFKRESVSEPQRN